MATKNLKKLAKTTGILEKDFEDALSFIDLSTDSIVWNTLIDSKEECAAIRKQNRLSREEVDDITTISKVREAYFTARSNSRKELAVLIKWIELCTTASEAEEVFYLTITREPELAALKKWIELCTTVDETRKIFYRTLRCSEENHAALRKIHDLFEDEE